MSKSKRTGLDPIYDEMYLRLKNESVFLSTQNQPITIHTVLWDRNNLEAERLVYAGDDEGHYFRNEQRMVAFIPGVKLKIEQLKEEFEDWQEQQVNRGFEKPTEMLPEMQERQSILEATLDVYREELAAIEKRLSTYTKTDEDVSEALCLHWGLVQSASTMDGKIVEIDGQSVGRNADGVFIIIDKRSRYAGMSIPDYRKLAVQWRKDIELKDVEELKRIQQNARERGFPIPTQHTTFGNVVPRDDLPRWPDWAKDYLEDPEVVRTK